MCELESGLMCKTRDVITQTPVRWVRTRAIVFELGSWCWDPRLRWCIGPLVVGRDRDFSDLGPFDGRRVQHRTGESTAASCA